MLVRNTSSLKNSLESDIFPKIIDNLEKNTKTIVYIYIYVYVEMEKFRGIIISACERVIDTMFCTEC